MTACPTGKPPYSKHAATLEAARRRDSRAPGSVNVTTYPCVCGAHHLTSGTATLTRRIRAALKETP